MRAASRTILRGATSHSDRFLKYRTVPGRPSYIQVPKRTSATTTAITPSPRNDDVPSPVRDIDFQVSSKIEGEESQIATINLRPGEVLRAESGSMLYMTDGVVMDTKLAGLSSAFNRVLTGQNVFLTDFRYEGNSSDGGTVCLGTDFPSKILRLNLSDFAGSSLICQKGAYLGSNPSVSLETEFTRSMTAGFFGGQGFILQRLSGDGDVLIKGGGTIVKKDLQEGETLRVTSGSIVAFESSVQYDVQMMPGIKNAIFGGEGLFITTLTGPGQVMLQGMPPDRMISEIARRIPSSGPGIGFGIPIGVGGGGGGADSAGVAGAADEAGAAVAGSGGEEAAVGSSTPVPGDEVAAAASSSDGLSSSTTTSDIDADSPSALFGDAVPQDASKDTSFGGGDDYASLSDDATDSDFSTTFTDLKDETTFDDITSTTADDFSLDEGMEHQDGELFDDLASSEEAQESASSMVQTIWDFFTKDQ